MLKTPLLHPDISAALGAAGHGSKILITDGNYPASTRLGPNADLVALNLCPGLINGTDVLKTIVQATPIESASVMEYSTTGPYAIPGEPDIWADFRSILGDAGYPSELEVMERFAFYDAAGAPDVCLTILTAEERIYANLLLTIGVVLS